MPEHFVARMGREDPDVLWHFRVETFPSGAERVHLAIYKNAVSVESPNSVHEMRLRYVRVYSASIACVFLHERFNVCRQPLHACLLSTMFGL